MATMVSEPVFAAPQGRSSAHDEVHVGDLAVGVVIGRASEYFDYFVYGIASALVFPAVFFPFELGLAGTLYAFLIFSFAFIARPVGTVLFMQIQSRWGREAKLTAALFLLGCSTAGIAFIPTYASVGFASIVLLSLFRVAQGIALGGSWEGMPSLLALHAPAHRRGWYAALGQLGAPIGFILASGLFAYLYASLSLSEFLEFGWRYPFYVAFAVNVVALFARLRLITTPEYAQLLDASELEPTNARELVREYGATVLVGAFAALGSYALFHLVTVFPLSWIKLFTDQSIGEFLSVQVLGGFLAIGATLVSGLIADRFGRRSTLGGFAVAIAVFSGFAPTLLNGGHLGQDVFILLGFILLGLSYGQSAGAVSSNFAPKYRYTGAALTTDLAWLLGAAFAPLVALGLSAHFGLGYVSVYLLSGALATLLALWINRAVISAH